MLIPPFCGAKTPLTSRKTTTIATSATTMTAMIPVELLCSNANTSSADFRAFVQAAYQATGRPKRPQRAVVWRSL